MAYFSLTDWYAERERTIGTGASMGATALHGYLTARPRRELVTLATQYGLEAPETMSHETLVQELTVLMLAQVTGQDTLEGGPPHA